MSWTSGETINTQLRLQRLSGSIPSSYTIMKIGSTYYAETNIPGGTEYGDSDQMTVIQAAVDALRAGGAGMRGCVGKIVFRGLFDITDSVNLTDARNLWLSGFGPLSTRSSEEPASGFLVKTNNIPFDLTNSRNIHFDNLDFEINPSYTPACILLLARDTGASSCGSHYFENCAFSGDASSSLIYNYGSELNTYNRCNFHSKRRSVIVTDDNIDSLASPFKTIAAGAVSINQVYVTGSHFYRTAGATGETILLDEPRETVFTKDYFAGDTLYTVKINDAMNGLHFNQCLFESMMVTMDAQGGSTTVDHLTIDGGYCSKAGAVIDLDKNNVIIRDSLLDNFQFAAGATVNFKTLYGSYIRFGEVNEPTLTISGSSRSSTIDVYDGSLVTNPNRAGVTLIYRKANELTKNTGTATIANGTTSTGNIAHGLGGTPTFFSVCGTTTDTEDLYCSSKDATNIVFDCIGAVGGDRTIHWKAEYEP